MEKLNRIYESKMDGNHTLHIISDSRQVKAEELQPGICYLQITAVNPIGRSVEEEVWSVLQTEGSFPALVNRLLLEEPRSSEGDQLPRLQSLQRILQGSVAVQVNSGVLSVCTAFLSGEPAARLSSQELQQLIAALLEFMAVCKRAIRVHFRLIGEEGQDFHTQLVNGFQSLTAELSHYIPAILAEL
uniref:DOCKER domain-containing protein n=1 Tax=Populus alba TaxID=43335 RepID=A0A4U5Q680_POPAL|nr:hypothetical protein D5086_0000130430 [Populus alba]